MIENFHRKVTYIDVTDPNTGKSHKVNTLVGKFGANPNHCTYQIGDGLYDLNYYHICKSCGGLLMNISIQRGQNYCCHSCYLSLRNKIAWQDPTYQQQKSEIFKKVITDTRTTSRALCMSAISQMRKQGWDKCYLYEADSQVKDSFKLGISVEPNRRERFGDVIPNIHSLAVGNPETICALEWVLKDKFLEAKVCNGERLNTEIYPSGVYNECIGTIMEVCANPHALIALINERKPFEHASDRYAGFCERLISTVEQAGLDIEKLDGGIKRSFSRINFGLLGMFESMLGGNKKEKKQKKILNIQQTDKRTLDLLLSRDPIIDDGKYVIIKNFPIMWFGRMIKRKYGGKKIMNIIQPVGRASNTVSRHVRIHKFFLPELAYLLGLGNGALKNSLLLNALVEYTWLKDLNTDKRYVNGANLENIQREMNVNLYDWQKDFILKYDVLRQKAKLNGELLSFGCGLGKTITSLALMTALGCDGVIIIAPKSTLVDVWVNHIKTFFKEPQPYYLVGQSRPEDARFFIFNYESMDKIRDVMPFLKSKKNIGIIADESHNFLKMKSQRTQNLIELRRALNCHHTLLMSGTPLKALGAEVIPLLKVVDSFFDDDAELIFKDAFGLNTSLGTDILHTRMNLIMYRKKMEDVFELPPKTSQTLEVKISNGSDYTTVNVKRVLIDFMEEREAFHAKKMSLYRDEWQRCMDFMEKDHTISTDPGWIRYKRIIIRLRNQGYDRFDKAFVKEVAWGNDYEKHFLAPNFPKKLRLEFEDCKSAIKYLDMKIQGEVLGKLDKIRGKMISSMLHGVDVRGLIRDSEKKIIFFTSYVEVVELLEKIISENGYKSILVYGKTSNQAEQLLNEFRNNDKYKVLIATMQTLSTGVTLTEANTIVFCNDPWRDADKEQASNRIWRIGQNTPCFIYTLHLNTGKEENLSDRTADILDWSKQMTEGMVDGVHIEKPHNFSYDCERENPRL